MSALNILGALLLTVLILMVIVCITMVVWIGVEELRMRIDERHEREQFRAMMRTDQQPGG